MVTNNITNSTTNSSDKWVILFIVCLGVMVTSINMSIINVSLPAISEYFSITLNLTEWIITSYFICYIGFVTLFAKIGNYKSHEKIFTIGMIIFTTASILCSIAPSIDFLIGARILQGFGASMTLAGPLVIIEDNFDVNTLGRAMGIFGMMVAIGLGLGPVIGGLTQAWLGWRAIFLITVPIAVIDILLSFKYLRNNKNEPLHVSILSGITEFLVVLSIIYTLNVVETGDYFKSIIFIIISAVLLVLMLYVEKRSDSPLVNWSLLKNFTFTSFNVTFHIIYICEYAVLYVLPFYTEKILGLDASLTGLMLTSAPLVMVIFAPISGIIADKKGSILPIITGLLLLVLSLILMLTLNKSSGELEICLYYAIMGIGIAFTQSPINKVLMSIVSINNKTSASSILTLFRTMGIAMASCYASIILSFSIPEGLLKNSEITGIGITQFMTGMDNIFLFGIIILIFSIILILIVKSKIKDRKQIIGRL